MQAVIIHREISAAGQSVRNDNQEVDEVDCSVKPVSCLLSDLPTVSYQGRADKCRPPRAAAAAAAAAEAQARARARARIPLQYAATIAGAFDPSAAAAAAAEAVAASVAAAHAARRGGTSQGPTANGGPSAAGGSHGRVGGTSLMNDGGSSGSEGIVLLGKRRRTAVDYQVRTLMAIHLWSRRSALPLSSDLADREHIWPHIAGSGVPCHGPCTSSHSVSLSCASIAPCMLHVYLGRQS